MPIIEVEHVTKEFRLGQLRTVRQSLSDLALRLRGGKPAVSAPFKALNDVNFKVEAGEVLGIIGHNGAGKSTLLKILAGISKPTRGRVAVRGKVAPLIEVGAGLVPDLTGRENIYLNATILGMKRAEIERKFKQIVAFAELEEFIDTPVKRYSSGMQVRLGFSIATSVEADILIVDEVLAVGDLAFQRKCFDRMEELIKRQGRTVLLVSHNIRQIERLCSCVALIASGKATAVGNPKEICDLFYEQSDAKIAQAGSAGSPTKRLRILTSSDTVEVTAVRLLDEAGQPSERIRFGSPVVVAINFRALAPIVNPVFGVGVHTTDFLYLASKDTEEIYRGTTLELGDYELRCTVRSLPFLPGVYSLRIGIASGEISSMLFYAENALHFMVYEQNGATRATRSESGFVDLATTWAVIRRQKPIADPQNSLGSSSEVRTRALER